MTGIYQGYMFGGIDKNKGGEERREPLDADGPHIQVCRNATEGKEEYYVTYHYQINRQEEI